MSRKTRLRNWLFYTIFDNPDSVRRNVTAAEVEKVIDVLASKAFSREQFLKSLDRLYVAIESAAFALVDVLSQGARLRYTKVVHR